MSSPATKALIPLFILICLTGKLPSSFGGFPGIETDVAVFSYGEFASYTSNFRVSKSVYVGSNVSIFVGLTNRLTDMIDVRLNYTFIEGENIPKSIGHTGGIQRINPNERKVNGIVLSRLRSTGIISLNISYEGATVTQEGGIINNFTSGGTVHEVYIEVIEPSPWSIYIPIMAIIGGIGAIVGIVYWRSKRR
jgi:hypothetical protein